MKEFRPKSFLEFPWPYWGFYFFVSGKKKTRRHPTHDSFLLFYCLGSFFRYRRQPPFRKIGWLQTQEIWNSSLSHGLYRIYAFSAGHSIYRLGSCLHQLGSDCYIRYRYFRQIPLWTKIELDRLDRNRNDFQ